jgi:hypothetical protein
METDALVGSAVLIVTVTPAEFLILKLDFLNAVHGDAHRKNILVIRKNGVDEFLKGERNW